MCGDGADAVAETNHIRPHSSKASGVWIRRCIYFMIGHSIYPHYYVGENMVSRYQAGFIGQRWGG